MISRNINIIINKDVASMNDKLYFYQGDKGIDIHFAIKEFQYGVQNNTKSMSLDGSTAGILIVDPDDIIIFDDAIPVEGNTVVMPISEIVTDVPGTYRFQIHIYDSNGGRVTTPPLSWEIKPLIAIAGETSQVAIVDEAIVGNDITSPTENISMLDLGEDAPLGIVGDNPIAEENVTVTDYVYTVWQPGEIITAGKLNNIETGLDTLNSETSIMSDNVEILNNFKETTEGTLEDINDAIESLNGAIGGSETSLEELARQVADLVKAVGDIQQWIDDFDLESMEGFDVIYEEL